jgi:hypothetical protein
MCAATPSAWVSGGPEAQNTKSAKQPHAKQNHPKRPSAAQTKRPLSDVSGLDKIYWYENPCLPP